MVSDILLVLVIVLVAVLFIRGPKMLPRIGEALGRTVKDTKAEFDRKSDDGPSGPSA